MAAEEIATTIRINRNNQNFNQILAVYTNSSFWANNHLASLDCYKTTCNAKEMAIFDIKTINKMVKNAIPNSHITVKKCSTFLCINIYWQANNFATACKNYQCVSLKFI